MSAAFAEQVRATPSQREPAYRPAVLIDDAEKAELAQKLGDASNYDLGLLREMIAQAPANIEFRKALVSGIVSAEYAGIDAFSRKVCEWQQWPVPWELITAMARQTWDEVRHAQLGTELLKSYGGEIGEYPDTLAGSPPSEANNAVAQSVGAAGGNQAANVMRDPIISLSVTNVALEGAALDLFKGTSDLGRRVNDDLMELVYDYNWADEVTHTAIGDYFVKALCDGNPAEEARALRAHAMFEGMRERLSGTQSAEIREFFAEEVERGTAALSGSGQ
ncbi:MAG: hypothetical protein AB7N24_04585 [Dehalococcoidia bacterium]